METYRARYYDDESIVNVGMPDSDWDFWRENSRLSRALIGGTKEVIRLSTGKDSLRDIIPKDEGESMESYKIRLSRTQLSNFYGKTIDRLTGAVFAKPVTVEKIEGDEIENYMENVDMKGNNLTTFSEDTFNSGLVDGSVFILVDYPKTNIRVREGRSVITEQLFNEDGEPYFRERLTTQKDLDENQWRPYFVLIRREEIIGCKFEYDIHGIEKLIQIRIREEIKVDSGDYDMDTISRIRVLEPGRFEVWESDEFSGLSSTKELSYKLVDEGETTLNEIPMVVWMPGRKISTITGEIPLQGLAELNKLHVQSSSDQRNVLHYARIIVWFGKCLRRDEDDSIILGANRMITSSDPSADLRIIEHSGSAISAGRQDLEDLKDEMSMWGLSLIAPQNSGGITATQRAMDGAESESTLKGYSLSFQNALSNAIKLMGKYSQKEDLDVSVSINPDFSVAMRGVDAPLLLDAYDRNVLPHEVVVSELKRRGIISDSWDIVDIKKMMENDERSPMNKLSGMKGFQRTGE